MFLLLTPRASTQREDSDLLPYRPPPQASLSQINHLRVKTILKKTENLRKKGVIAEELLHQVLTIIIKKLSQPDMLGSETMVSP